MITFIQHFGILTNDFLMLTDQLDFGAKGNLITLNVCKSKM